MNTYKITLFVLGLDPHLNTRVEYVNAETEEEAEKEVVGDGWGVLKTELMDFVNSIVTRKQPLSDMYSGMRAVEMVEECLKYGFFKPSK